MIKVTHIITGLNRGGAERALFSILTNGLQSQFSNRVVSLRDAGAYGPRLEAAGIPVTALNIHHTLGGLQPLLRELRFDPPDVLQGWMYHGSFAATLAGHILPSRPIVSWNIRCAPGLAGDTGRSTRLLVRILRALSKLPRAIIYNAENSLLAHRQQGFCSARASVIANGFNLLEWRRQPEPRQTARLALKLPTDRTIIGYVGRNHPQKDLPTLFSAISILKSHSKAPHFVLVGKDLKAAAPSDLDPIDVTFLGERADVENILQAFDFLCLSSKSEGFPNVLGEAMASGIPCLTTDAGDASEIVSDTGWVVPRENPIALAAAMQRALNLDPQELALRSAAARSRIENSFSIETTVAKYSSLYQRLLSETRQCAG